MFQVSLFDQYWHQLIWIFEIIEVVMNFTILFRKWVFCFKFQWWWGPFVKDFLIFEMAVCGPIYLCEYFYCWRCFVVHLPWIIFSFKVIWNPWFWWVFLDLTLVFSSFNFSLVAFSWCFLCTFLPQSKVIWWQQFSYFRENSYQPGFWFRVNHHGVGHYRHFWGLKDGDSERDNFYSCCFRFTIFRV